MNLRELNVDQFLEEFSSKSPAPGGGSAASASGALGVALVMMVAKQTQGKKTYSRYEAQIEELLGKLTQIQIELANNIEKDAGAINSIREAMSLPDFQMAERLEKREVMDTSLKGATLVPAEVMTLCMNALNAIEKDMDKLNFTARSTIATASILLSAGMRAAYLNVLENTKNIMDEKFVSQHKKQALDTLTLGDSVHNRIYAFCLNDMRG